MSITIEEFTTSKGNEIEIYTTSIIGKDGCVVFDKSCQLERAYWIGRDAFLSWDEFENGYQPIKSIQSVVDAWKNENIHF